MAHSFATLKEDGKRVDLFLYSLQVLIKFVYSLCKGPRKSCWTWWSKGEKEYEQTLDANSGLGISNYTGYYYHYQIERQGKTVLVLDPYAKSLAAWNGDLKTDAAHKVAKAAFVDPAVPASARLDLWKDS